MKKMFILFTLVLFAATAFTQVVVEVNGKAATVDDLKLESTKFGDNATVDMKMVKDRILDELIKKQLLLSEAEKANLESDASYLKLMESYKKQALIQTYLEKVVKPKITVTDSEIVARYKNDPRYYRPERLRVAMVTGPAIAEFNTELATNALSKMEEVKAANGMGTKGPDMHEELSKAGMGMNMMEIRQDDRFSTSMPKLWTAKIGEIVGPVDVDGKKILAKATERIKDDSTPFESVKDKIAEDLRKEKLDSEKNRIVDELKQKATITIHNDVLNNL